MEIAHYKAGSFELAQQEAIDEQFNEYTRETIFTFDDGSQIAFKDNTFYVKSHTDA